MKTLLKAGIAATTLAAMASTAFADGRNPGSVLVYPIHRSGLVAQPTCECPPAVFFTVISVTNTNLDFAGTAGSTNVQFDYVNVVKNPFDPFHPLDCYVFDRVEELTAADTFSVLTSCHNAAGAQEGYLVVTAQDPDKFKTAWSWNYLVGSELVVTSLGGVYSINAIPFTSDVAERSETDLDGDDQRDFDDAEYEGIAEELYIDSFLALSGSSLTLINMTGGVDFKATVKFDIFNDNEFPLSATKSFRCWFEEPLTSIGAVFSQAFLENNTPNDPYQLDINCDLVGDIETGWAVIDGIVASSSAQTQPNPALLGAITAGPAPSIDGGRLLWESAEKQLNGDFLKVGVIDPEYP